MQSSYRVIRFVLAVKRSDFTIGPVLAVKWVPQGVDIVRIVELVENNMIEIVVHDLEYQLLISIWY